jgi:hypothetical protein
VKNRLAASLPAALLLSLAVASSAIEYQVVAGDDNCIGLQEAAQVAGLALTPGITYTAVVTGTARANPAPDGEYDGIFCFYYDAGDLDHPMTVYLPKGDSFQFVASSASFYAFLVDKTVKDIADNSGSLTVTLLPEGGGPPEEIVVDAVFNCIGLEEFAAAKKILIPGEGYSISVTGDAHTNEEATGNYDGVLLFTRDASISPVRPILVHLDFGEEFVVSEMHATGWVYCFLVDESYGSIGDNGGEQTVAFKKLTPVEDQTWAGVKTLFR